MIYVLGGGANLNFKVVGGTRTPSNPGENTIWVNTDTEITSWMFSATEPESLTDGMVWFCVGASGNTELNALKKNGIIVYPIRASQCIDGAWADKEAEIYQAGAWKPITSTQFVFKQSEGAFIPLSTGSQEPALFGVTITNDNIYAYGYSHSDSAVSVSVWTESEKDLFGYTTLCFDLSISTTWPGGTIAFGVSRDPMKAADHATMPFIAKKSLSTCSRQTISIDIADIDKGYIGACGCGNYYIYNWWYE